MWGMDKRGAHNSWREALLDIASDRPGDRTHGWRLQLANSVLGSGAFERSHERLAELVVHCPEVRHLVHADLLDGNVLVSDDRVTALLDWGQSRYGDFLFDLAWFSFWSPWYPAMKGIDFHREARDHWTQLGVKVPNFYERLTYYEIYIGLESQVYNAFKGRWKFVQTVGERTLNIAGKVSLGKP